MASKKLTGSITALVPLPKQLSDIPPKRLEDKLQRSTRGVGIMLVAFGIFLLFYGFDAYLIVMKPNTRTSILAAVAIIGTVLPAVLAIYGALKSDGETNWMALRGMLAIVAVALRLKRGAKA